MNRNKKELAEKLHLTASALCALMALGAIVALHFEWISRLSMWPIFLACMLVSGIEFKKYEKASTRRRMMDEEADR